MVKDTQVLLASLIPATARSGSVLKKAYRDRRRERRGRGRFAAGEKRPSAGEQENKSGTGRRQQ